MGIISAAQYNNFMVSEDRIAGLFTAIPNTQAQYDSLSNSALSRGIDLYTNENYEGAVKEFKRAVRLSPFSENGAKAYEYIALAYLQDGDKEGAIKTYQEAIRAYPAKDSFHISLGDIYYKQGKLPEAEAEYTAAIKIDSKSTKGRYGLGQVYLNSEKYSEAETQFKKVVTLSPRSSIGCYGLGQTYRKMGNYSQALTSLDKAVSLDRSFYAGYLEQGYTYADMGDADNADRMVGILSEKGSSLSYTLTSYIYENKAPQISLVYATNGFNPSSGPGTLLSALDASLSASQASQAFTVRFAFTKEMDDASIRDPFNWSITKADGTKAGGSYNWGMPAETTDIVFNSFPASVIYDSESFSADVTFQISQTSAADGTIDPSHIMFRFHGQDAYGKSMDSAADEYSGISEII